MRSPHGRHVRLYLVTAAHHAEYITDPPWKDARSYVVEASSGRQARTLARSEYIRDSPLTIRPKVVINSIWEDEELPELQRLLGKQLEVSGPGRESLFRERRRHHR